MERWKIIADYVDWDAVAKHDSELTRESFTSDINFFVLQ